MPELPWSSAPSEWRSPCSPRLTLRQGQVFAAEDGVLYGYVHGALLGFEPGGRALPEIALPREQLERPRVSVSDRFVAVFDEDGRAFLVVRTSGAVHRWRPEGAAAGARFALGFSAGGTELLALAWPGLVLERYALP